MPVEGKIGTDLLHLAHENEIDLEGKNELKSQSISHSSFYLGACEGSLACSTCHVILEQKFFDMLPEAQIEEEDMLDLAFGLTRT